MTWTPPATWSAVTVTVAMFNEQIRDNLLELKDPPSYIATGLPVATIAATAFSDYASASAVLTTNGGDLFVGAMVTWRNYDFADLRVGVNVDGTDYEVYREQAQVVTTLPKQASVMYPVTGLAAGSHTIKLRMRVNSTANSAQIDDIAAFWVREIS